MSSNVFTEMLIGVVSNFVGNVLAHLSTQAFKQLEMVIELEDDLKKLKSKVSYIQAVLIDAKERSTKSCSLKDFLRKLEETLYDADDVIDEISTEAISLKVMTGGKNAKDMRIFFSESNQVAFKIKMASRIKKITERLDEISNEKIKFGFTDISEPRMIQDDGLTSHQMGIHSALNVDEVIGRDNEKVNVKGFLLNMDVQDHNVSFIAIAGMGGIGKTILAKLLYNDIEVSKHFDLKMWVEVSNQFKVKRVVEKMIESASGSKTNVQEMDRLCDELQKVIGGKKYLLVMDDVWDESEKQWEELTPLLMNGACGSKILITMCNRIIPTEIESMTKLINLEGLSDDSSWSLFQKVGFKELRNPNMIQLGKEILEKCGGVPLIIRHIGRVLHSRFSEEEWISIKTDELLRISGEKNYDMISILALSYKHLPPHLKQCFAYSSLYTKNDCITKDKLMRQWVARGFVKSSGESKSMEDIANDYFTELCWRFFYKHQDDNNVGIHDIMCDFARKIAGTELYACRNLKDDGEGIRHCSLLEAKMLRTLCMSGFKSIEEGDLGNLVSNFPRLRVLDLSGGTVKTVPDSLKNLKHLRYLDLSNNLDLQSLPNLICELINLQTLYLNGCKALKELPTDIKNLVNLRHLELVGSLKITHMPIGIGKLTCLQTLSLFVLDENNQGSKLGELNGLRDLRGGLFIKGLEQLRDNSSEANLKDKKGLRDLILQWNPKLKKNEAKDDATTLEGLEFHPNVESVCIWWYEGAELPNWMINPLSKLTYISLAKCNKLQHLPQFDQLPALKRLHLDGLTSIQFMDNNNSCSSSSTTSVFFPCLDILILKDMPNLEGWWKEESRVLVGDEESEKRRELLPNFARLTELSIDDCPKLGWLPRQPSLRVVELDKVGAWMVRSIGPSSNLEYLTLKNIEDLESLPSEICSSSNIKLKISNCPSLPEPTVPPFLCVDYDNSANGE